MAEKIVAADAAPTKREGVAPVTDRKRFTPEKAEREIEKATELAFDALTLILAAGDLNEQGPCLAGPAGLTDKTARVTALAVMASRKTSEAIQALNATREALHA